MIRPGGNGNARKPRHVDGDGEDIVEIHLHRVGVHFLIGDAEGCRRGCRRQDGVDTLSEGILEILLDQRAHLLGLEVVGIVIACRQHIGADHDAALDLGTETGSAGVLVHFDDVPAVYPQAVAHTVIARQVRGGFGGRDDVIGRQRVFGMRQGDVDDLGTRGTVPVDALLPQRLDLFRHAVHAVFGGNADLHALYRLADGSLIVGLGQGNGSGVLVVDACHRLQQDRRIAHVAGNRTCLIER